MLLKVSCRDVKVSWHNLSLDRSYINLPSKLTEVTFMAMRIRKILSRIRIYNCLCSTMSVVIKGLGAMCFFGIVPCCKVMPFTSYKQKINVNVNV